MGTIDEATSFEAMTRSAGDPDLEIQAELLSYIMARKGSLPYYRSAGTSLADMENRPLNPFTSIQVTVDIIEAVQSYNDSLSESLTERRVAIQAESIDLKVDKETESLMVDFNYTPIKDAKTGFTEAFGAR